MKTWKLGYEKAKLKAKNVYAKIKHIPCEALGGECIVFTGIGFAHLMRKGRIPRTRNEQKRRFVLIPHITSILSGSRATIEYRREARKVEMDRRGVKTTVTSVAEFWTFVERIDDCTVKVVIRQLDTGGPKHFFSVMGDNVTVVRRQSKNKKPRP